jgi:hypothetical protein
MVKGMEDHFNGMKYDRITALEDPNKRPVESDFRLASTG